MGKPSSSPSHPQQADSCVAPKGILMAIGGNEDKGNNSDPASYQHNMEHIEQLRILRLFVELMGREKAKIALITTATSEPAKSFLNYKAAFRKLGVTGIMQVHDTNRQEALSAKTVSHLAAADAFIFSGGDQLRLTSVYGGSPQLELLRKRYQEEEIVLAGTSAGAMAFSSPMIFQAAHDIDVLKGEVQIAAGFGLLSWATIDTHFLERGRLARLVQVLATNPGYTGFGIEEDTAIIVREGRQVEVAGNGTVLVLEGHKSHCANIADVANGNPVSIRDLQMHLLVSGDTYTPPGFDVAAPPARQV